MVKMRDINKDTLTTIKGHIKTERGSGKALQLHPPHAGAARIQVAALQGKGRWLLLKRTTSMRGQGTRGRGSGKAVRLESTRSSSNYSTHTLQVRPDGRSGPPEHHDHSSHPASNTRTESLARSGVKRKAAAGDDVCNSKRTSVFRGQEEQR